MTREEALLNLIADLYAQIQAAGQRIQELELAAKIAEDAD